jgi:hypothetical protein
MGYKELVHEFIYGEVWYNGGSQYMVLEAKNKTVKFKRLSDGYVLKALNTKLFEVESPQGKTLEVIWAHSNPSYS